MKNILKYFLYAIIFLIILAITFVFIPYAIVYYGSSILGGDLSVLIMKVYLFIILIMALALWFIKH